MKGSRAAGHRARFSRDQARQAVEDDAKDRLIGGARRQVDLDLLFQFDDAGGDLDEAQPQSVELHDAPGRALGISRRIDQRSQSAPA